MNNQPERPLELTAIGATDVGMKRRLNEDVFRVAEDISLFLVADGMGGHAAGEVASKLAADEIVGVYGRRSAQADRSRISNEPWLQPASTNPAPAGSFVPAPYRTLSHTKFPQGRGWP